MIELDITTMVDDADEMWLLSGSAMEHGQDAGRITWRNSCEYAARHPLLTPDQYDDVRDYFREFGAWSREEIDAWTPEEIQGIVSQEVAAQIREMEHYDTYEEYEQAANNGQCLGNIYRGDGGRFYFTLGH